MRSALITGGAGFIGSHLVDRLIDDNWRVTVVDNCDAFYDPRIKRANISRYLSHPLFRFAEADIRDRGALASAADQDYDAIVHLAAKAGVRQSIAEPVACQDVNVAGTQNVLELARARGVAQFVFGSSSSVYGINQNVPWTEEDAVLKPISPYASTKISGELMGHVYSHLYGIRFICLRFFTVYGPRQRPDLAFHKFARKMLAGEPVPVYGDGRTRRDYTFVGDIVNGIVAAMRYEGSRYEIVNLGCGRPVTLLEMIAALENALGVTAMINFEEEQPGDVPQTFASIEKARRLLNYEPATPLAEGVEAFTEWLLAPAGVAAGVEAMAR